MMMIYDVMPTIINFLLMLLHVPLTLFHAPSMLLHDPPMFFHVPLTFFHAPLTFLKDLQTFDDTSLMHSKALLGFNHQPWAILLKTSKANNPK